MAYAAARFADSVIRAMNGEELVEFAYVPVEGIDGVNVDYFSCALSLAQDGSIQKNLGLGVLNEREQGLVSAACAQLQGEIAKVCLTFHSDSSNPIFVLFEIKD